MSKSAEEKMEQAGKHGERKCWVTKGSWEEGWKADTFIGETCMEGMELYYLYI